jgi:hypothetical protein
MSSVVLAEIHWMAGLCAIGLGAINTVSIVLGVRPPRVRQERTA